MEAGRGDILARLRELERRVDAQEMVRSSFSLSIGKEKRTDGLVC